MRGFCRFFFGEMKADAANANCRAVTATGVQLACDWRATGVQPVWRRRPTAQSSIRVMPRPSAGTQHRKQRPAEIHAEAGDDDQYHARELR